MPSSEPAGQPAVWERCGWSFSCLVLPTLLLAQGTGGRILGRVSDPTGAVLSSVKVTATNEATGVSRDAVSNDSGDYVLVPDVAVGTYTVSFDLNGFKKSVRKAHRSTSTRSSR